MKFGPSTTVSTEVDVELATALERHAEENDPSKAAVVRRALRQYLTEELNDDLDLLHNEIDRLEDEIQDLEGQRQEADRQLEKKRALKAELEDQVTETAKETAEEELERLEEAEVKESDSDSE